MVERLHLSERHRRALEALLREHLPGVEVWAYGSRVNGRSHDGSDLDLALRGPRLEEIPAERLTAFEEAVRESNIPFLVEARDWARLPERFHREIERDLLLSSRLEIEAGVVKFAPLSNRTRAGDWIECTLSSACSAVDYGLTMLPRRRSLCAYPRLPDACTMTSRSGQSKLETPCQHVCAQCRRCREVQIARRWRHSLGQNGGVHRAALCIRQEP